MEEAAIARHAGPHEKSHGRRAAIISITIMINSLFIILFMWYATFGLLRAGDNAFINVISSSVRTSTLAYNARKLFGFLRRGYTIKSIDEILRSFGILELINSGALLVFMTTNISLLEEVGLPVGGRLFVALKGVVFLYFLLRFLDHEKLDEKPDKSREANRRHLRDLVLLAFVDGVTIVVYTWLILVSFTSAGDPRAGMLTFIAIAQTATVLIMLAIYVYNHLSEKRNSVESSQTMGSP